MTLTDAQDIVQAHAPKSYYAEYYRACEGDYLPHLCALLEELPAGRALDVGPGWGTMMVWLAARGWEVVVADYVPLGFHITPRLVAVTGARYVQANIFTGPLAYGQFDLITMTQVIPHLKWRPDRALRNCGAMLAEGGQVIVCVLDLLDYADLHATYDARWWTVPEYGDGEPSPDMVICMYTQETLLDLLGGVFAEVKAWKPEGSTVLFGQCRQPILEA